MNKKWNQIGFSLRFLSGQSNLIILDEYKPETSTEMDKFYSVRLSNKNKKGSPIVPRSVLYEFVKRFFGMDRKTFISYMKKAVEDEIVETVRLQKKGRFLGYVWKKFE